MTVQPPSSVSTRAAVELRLRWPRVIARSSAWTRALAAALASGILLWASQPPVGAGWLAWIALVPAAAAALEHAGTRAGRLAVPLAYGLYLELLLVPAFPFGMAAGEWGEPPPVVVGESPVLAIALVAVPAAAALLYLVRFGSPWRRASRGPLVAVGAVLMPALAFTALDFLRLSYDPGGWWGPLFLSQAGEPTAAAAALGGPWLLTLAIVAVNYTLALVVVRGRAALPSAGTVVALAAALALGSWAVTTRDPTPTGVVPAAVQPGYHTVDRHLPELKYFHRGSWYLAARDTIDDLGALTATAAERGANLVVWPEAAIWVDPYRFGTIGDELERLAARTGATLVVPWFDGDGRHGAAVTVDPADGLLRAQPKQRPMWFLGERDTNRVPPAPVSSGGVAVGTLLGVDAQAPDLARRLAVGSESAPAAAVLASSTHDWQDLASRQASLARLTAVATGAPIVRSDWRFGSEVVDGDGSLAASAGPGLERAVVVGQEVAGRETPYLAIGDALGWAAAALAALAVAGLAMAPFRSRLGGRLRRVG